jgi:hypothetical protein
MASCQYIEIVRFWNTLSQSSCISFIFGIDHLALDWSTLDHFELDWSTLDHLELDWRTLDHLALDWSTLQLPNRWVVASQRPRTSNRTVRVHHSSSKSLPTRENGSDLGSLNIPQKLK